MDLTDNDKSSFWKKNSKTVPGRFVIKSLNRSYLFLRKLFRPSPKKDLKVANKVKTTGSTSFQDFEASVNDAWALDDDEFCIISSGLESKLL